MKILCQNRYEEAVKYAKDNNDTSLQDCLDSLKRWEINSQCEIELYYDFAPLSFGFRELYPGGKTGIVGGLLYHGVPDQSFAVAFNVRSGWQIHT